MSCSPCRLPSIPDRLHRRAWLYGGLSSQADSFVSNAGPVAAPVATYDRLVNDAVVLPTVAMPPALALVLRPWRMEDVPALVEVFQDPALRRWTNSAVKNDADAIRWVQAQQRGWAAGDRFGFAVLETRSDSPHGQLVGNVVLKEVAPGKPSAEVGYWTAAHARGKGVAPRAARSGGSHRLGLRHFGVRWAEAS
ncbi:GNAT family N-acetyltransferase [Micromonospora fiedleri]|uniref:GNAT family N-acetyltransferase n=1 Tax=Micromonospora fiedleri TaxID=1157498 RepID=UPI0027DAF706|nr:GNAT family N-acetyltransferase [Micromonospora fiedleri]